MTDPRHNKRKRTDEDDEEHPRVVAKRLAPRVVYDFNDTIIVLVGKGKRQFTVHKDIICEKSKFFKAACSRRWLEGRKRVVNLPEIHAADFQVYVQWVYTSQIAMANEKKEESQEGLLGMYLLGDFVDDYQFRNKVLEMALANIGEYSPLLPSGSFYKRAYEETPAGSPLRKVLVEWTLMKMSRERFEENAQKYPVEFVREVAVRLMMKTPYSSAHETMLKLKDMIRPEKGDA